MGYIGIGESVADTRLNPDLFFDIQSDKSLKYQFKQPDKWVFNEQLTRRALRVPSRRGQEFWWD